MAKLILKAVGVVLLGLGFATGAWAQPMPDACSVAQAAHTGLLSSNCMDTPTYASEIFGAGGDDVVLEYPADVDGETSAIPRVIYDGSGNTRAAGQRMELKYTLVGAVFDKTVGIGNLASDGDGTDIDAFSFQKESGGARGDKSVTYTITGDTEAALGMIYFEVPPLTMARVAMTHPRTPGVKVSVSLTAVSSGSGAAFPAMFDFDHDDDANTAAIPTLENGNVYVLGGASPALSLQVAAGTTGEINVEERAKLAGAHVRSQQMSVGKVTLEATSPIPVLADGETQFSVAERGGAGDLTVMVMGELRSDDTLFLDYMADTAGRTMTVQDDEVLEMDDGMAMLDVDLEDLFSDADADRDTPPTPPAGALTVYYVPNGKDSLRSGSFKTTFGVDYNRSTNMDPVPTLADSNPVTPQRTPLVTELMYEGAASAVKAYAIAPYMEGGDMSNVRIRCDAPTDCQVYLACDGADGSGYFGKLTPEIPARGVETLQTMEIAEVIGADPMEDFMGRMSCEAIGSSINVQVLTRSGGTLVNNTYVEE